MEIIPGVHMVGGVRGPSCYLIADDGLALVDAGLPGNAGAILRYIREIGREPSELRYVILTHSHPDHVGSATHVRARSAALILAHQGDTRANGKGKACASYMGLFGSLPVPFPFLRRVPVDRLAYHGEVLPLLGGMHVLHTPGHTPGSICLYLPQRKAIFTGDLVVGDRRGIGRSLLFPGSNPQHYQRSLEYVGELDLQVAFLGHGMPIIGGASQVIRAIAHRQPQVSWWRRAASHLSH